MYLQGDNPSKMWEEVKKAIAEVFVKKEKHIIEAVSIHTYLQLYDHKRRNKSLSRYK